MQTFEVAVREPILTLLILSLPVHSCSASYAVNFPLTGLTLSPLTLTPSFSASISTYSVSAATSLPSANLAATWTGAGYTVQFSRNGDPFSVAMVSGTSVPVTLQSGPNVITVRVS